MYGVLPRYENALPGGLFQFSDGEPLESSWNLSHHAYVQYAQIWAYCPSTNVSLVTDKNSEEFRISVSEAKTHRASRRLILISDIGMIRKRSEVKCNDYVFLHRLKDSNEATFQIAIFPPFT